MNAERGRWHKPAIESGRCNDAFAIENACDTAAAYERLVDCGHARPLGALRINSALGRESVGVGSMNQSKNYYDAIEIFYVAAEQNI
jgi:hypothetical protein